MQDASVVRLDGARDDLDGVLRDAVREAFARCDPNGVARIRLRDESYLLRQMGHEHGDEIILGLRGHAHVAERSPSRPARDADAELFMKLAQNGSVVRFTRLDGSAGQGPRAFARRILPAHENDATRILRENEGRNGLFHGASNRSIRRLCYESPQ